MAELITSITTFVTASLEWMTSVAELVTAQPILLLFVCAVPVVGLGIGLFKRIIA